MNQLKLIIFFVCASLIFSCASTPQKLEDVTAVAPPPQKEPLFALNSKDTIYIEKCNCSVRKLAVESGAGAFGNAFMAQLTPESEREYELSCKGKVTNKTNYKLQNVKFQWEYLSATKFPMDKGQVREYKNNYIMPKSSANISIVIGTDTGIKNYFSKEVKHYDCKVVSVVLSESGESIP